MKMSAGPSWLYIHYVILCQAVKSDLSVTVALKSLKSSPGASRLS